jgi:subtilisin family serine protease
VPGGNAPIYGVQANGADQPTAQWLISLKTVSSGPITIQGNTGTAKDLTCSFAASVGCPCQQYYSDMQIVSVKCSNTNIRKLTTHPTAKQTVTDVTFNFPVKSSGRSLFQSPSVNSTGAATASAPTTVSPQAFTPTCSSGSQITKPSWGLDRINQKVTALDMKYDWVACGSSIVVYVLDTGVENVNNEFDARAQGGVDCTSGTCVASSLYDCQGHGTHCAGTVGSKTYGVAKGTNIVNVRVLDCGGSGDFSTVIAGLNWVATASAPGKRKVVSMSLGGSGQVPAMDTAIENLVTKKNIPVVVAAGNDASDACYYTPASAPYAITVGATDISDNLAYFSNYGPCINVNAPGQDIWSISRAACSNSPTYTCTLSGTSMATPHVAGSVALYLSNNPSAAAFPTVYSNVRTLGGPLNGYVPGGTTKTLVYSKM